MSVLAISGKKGVGKDVVGKIIQYLTSESNVYPFDLKLDYSYRSNWQIRKFADKLKDIICILIGSTREQLEDESFKSKELGEEWWYWYMEREGGYSPIILDYLTTTKKELKNEIGCDYRTITTYISRLLKDGKIKVDKSEKRDQSKIYIKA